MKTKTGECYFRDEDDNLWLAESFVDENGVTTTKQSLVEESGNIIATRPAPATTSEQ